MGRSKKCETPNCWKTPQENRRLCATCRSREYRKKNPINCIWHWIKKSAKKRNIHFNLDKEEFRKFLLNTGYVEGRGRLRDQLTLDRRDGSKGYEIDNLKVITKSANCSKYHKGDKETEVLTNAPF